MVLARSPGSIDAILYKVISELTPQQVFEATGRESSYFCHAANPDRRERLAVDDAIALDVACRDAGKPALLLRAYQDRIEAQAPRPMKDLGHGLRRTSIELGELHAVADKALEDGNVTASEAREIAREAQELADEARSIRDAMVHNSGVRDMVSG